MTSPTVSSGEFGASRSMFATRYVKICIDLHANIHKQDNPLTYTACTHTTNVLRMNAQGVPMRTPNPVTCFDDSKMTKNAVAYAHDSIFRSPIDRMHTFESVSCVWPESKCVSVSVSIGDDLCLCLPRRL